MATKRRDPTKKRRKIEMRCKTGKTWIFDAETPRRTVRRKLDETPIDSACWSY
jgi:hypothetical protein